MVSCWHSCTFISWEKPRELPHFIFLLSLKLHDSKLMLKLYYLRAPTYLLLGCDTNVALDSGLSLGAWNPKLTTPDWKKQSVKRKNLLTEISLTKVFKFVRKFGLLISGRKIKKNTGPRRGRGWGGAAPHFLKKKKRNTHFEIKGIFDRIGIFDWQTSPKHPNLWLVRFDPISYGDPQNDYLYKTQGHPATIFCKITVWRSKYCLEISKAWEKLNISG